MTLIRDNASVTAYCYPCSLQSLNPMEHTLVDPVRGDGGIRTLIGYEPGPRYHHQMPSSLRAASFVRNS